MATPQLGNHRAWAFKHRVSPYLGMRLEGKVQRTFLRGAEIYDVQGHPAGPVGALLLSSHNALRSEVTPTR